MLCDYSIGEIIKYADSFKNINDNDAYKIGLILDIQADWFNNSGFYTDNIFVIYDNGEEFFVKHSLIKKL